MQMRRTFGALQVWMDTSKINPTLSYNVSSKLIRQWPHHYIFSDQMVVNSLYRNIWWWSIFFFLVLLANNKSMSMVSQNSASFTLRTFLTTSHEKSVNWGLICKWCNLHTLSPSVFMRTFLWKQRNIVHFLQKVNWTVAMVHAYRTITTFYIQKMVNKQYLGLLLLEGHHTKECNDAKNNTIGNKDS